MAPRARGSAAAGFPIMRNCRKLVALALRAHKVTQGKSFDFYKIELTIDRAGESNSAECGAPD